MGQTKPFKGRKRLSPAQRASRPNFEARISTMAKETEDRAWRTPPGPERDALLRKARQMDVASHISEWISSPGLQAPK
jgi:hypothetical protein